MGNIYSNIKDFCTHRKKTVRSVKEEYVEDWYGQSLIFCEENTQEESSFQKAVRFHHNHHSSEYRVEPVEKRRGCIAD
jgi:hypothetical protein